MYPEAIAETRKAMQLGNFGNGYLGLWLAKSGNRDEALKVLEDLKQEATVKYIQNYILHLSTLGLEKKKKH